MGNTEIELPKQLIHAEHYAVSRARGKWPDRNARALFAQGFR
jgi:hypothetical protein